MKRASSLTKQAAALALLSLVAACGRHEGGGNAGQVVARVNGGELTVHQLNYALQRTSANGSADSRALLDQLVDQQLLVEAAQEKKLDRDPRVVLALDAARREVLARAYLEQVAANPVAADAGAVHRYYEEHPELFKDRRVYRFRQISLTGTVPAAVAQATMNPASLDDVAARLGAQGLKYGDAQLTRNAEQLPLEILPRFHALQPGQVLRLPAQDGLVFVQLIDARREPLDEQTARPLIERFLANRHRGDAARAEVARLKSGAKVEYLGQFAKAPAAVVPVSAESEKKPDEDAALVRAIR